MRILKKEKQVKEVEVVLEDYNICDKCGKTLVKELYDAFECNFLFKEGTAYPEGGDGEKHEMELCNDCALEVVELLRKNGYNVVTSEWGY